MKHYAEEFILKLKPRYIQNYALNQTNQNEYNYITKKAQKIFNILYDTFGSTITSKWVLCQLLNVYVIICSNVIFRTKIKMATTLIK